jgi:hypothetical protein
MAKLYAQVTSDKGSRVVGKGGDEYITITVREGNVNVFDITFKSNKRNAYLDILRYSDGTTTRHGYLNPDIPT